MKTSLFAASIAIATLAATATSFAGMGIPTMPAQPLVSATAPGTLGQTYPAFGATHRPVVSERFATRVGGQTYPTFAGPDQSASRFAQAQVGRVAG